MSVVALSELLGASVRDASGAVRGRVREIAVAPQDHPTRIAFLIVKTPDGERESTPVNSHLLLNILAVDVGARGAIRRLSKGVVPSFTLRALLEKIPPRVIPWQFVDLLETDPARRVKLKIAYGGLAKLHPADIADIVEDLPPAEREAVFETIDEEVAAEALE